MRTYAFRAERAWRPPDNATPTFGVPNKSWNQGLSADVKFVSVLAIVLSQYWKRLEEKFQNEIISAISQNEAKIKGFLLVYRLFLY